MSKKTIPDAAQNWPANTIEWRPVNELKLRKSNPNTHSLEQIEQIVASMQQFGWTIPVLIDETGELLAGHGRVRAARLAGFPQAPCIVARGWSDAQKAAYVIADNKIGQNSEWDPKLLRAEFAALKVADFDLNVCGFNPDELNSFILEAAKPDKSDEKPDEVTMLKCNSCGRYSQKR
jgi:ParB-like chromosome segregation protein Spo0J